MNGPCVLVRSSSAGHQMSIGGSLELYTTTINDDYSSEVFTSDRLNDSEYRGKASGKMPPKPKKEKTEQFTGDEGKF